MCSSSRAPSPQSRAEIRRWVRTQRELGEDGDRRWSSVFYLEEKLTLAQCNYPSFSFFLQFSTKLSETAFRRVGWNPTSFSWTSRPSTTQLDEAVEQKVQLDQWVTGAVEEQLCNTDAGSLILGGGQSFRSDCRPPWATTPVAAIVFTY